MTITTLILRDSRRSSKNQNRIRTSRRLPGRPVLPHGLEQFHEGRQAEAVGSWSASRREHEQHHEQLPSGIRQLRRQSRHAVRQHGAQGVSITNKSFRSPRNKNTNFINYSKINSLKEPCDGCAAPYGYRNHMPLSQNTRRFAVSMMFFSRKIPEKNVFPHRVTCLFRTKCGTRRCRATWTPRRAVSTPSCRPSCAGTRSAGARRPVSCCCSLRTRASITRATVSSVGSSSRTTGVAIWTRAACTRTRRCRIILASRRSISRFDTVFFYLLHSSWAFPDGNDGSAGERGKVWWNGGKNVNLCWIWDDLLLTFTHNFSCFLTFYITHVFLHFPTIFHPFVHFPTITHDSSYSSTVFHTLSYLPYFSYLYPLQRK